jgi:hypothetical protein
VFPQWLKPDSLQSIYVRPEGRTLQKNGRFELCPVIDGREKIPIRGPVTPRYFPAILRCCSQLADL